MKTKELKTKKIGNPTFLNLFVLLLFAAAVTYLGQIPASMQESITPENSATRSRETRDAAPQDAVVCETTEVSTNIGYATTLRFPGGGVTENNLISFNLATPGTLITDVPVMGLNTAISEYMSSIDFRPATGELYGLVVQNNVAAGGSGTIRIVKVNPTTGATTAIGTPTTVVDPGNFSGFDFNPVVDRIRVTRIVSPGRDQNLRFDPTTGVATIDTGLQFAAGDPNAAADEFVAGNAYTNSTSPAPTTTTLYGIDAGVDALVIQGATNPPGPNGGVLTTVGPLGVNTTGLAGFDISSSNAAYAILDTLNNGASFGAPGRLYTINLTTGAATLVAPIGGLASRFTSSFAIGATAPSAQTACGTRAEAEPNNTIATANVMNGTRAIGSINPAGDFDYYRIDNVPANSLLFAFTDSGVGPTNPGAVAGQTDTVLRVFAADGTTEIEEDEDDGTATGGNAQDSGLSSIVAGTPLTAGGTYYIEVSASNVNALIGQYTLFARTVAATATAETEPNNTTATATALPLNQLTSGTVSSTDPDFFAVTLTAGNTVELALDGDPERNSFGTGAIPSVDHQLGLIGPDGTTVLLNANSAGTTGSVFGTVQGNPPAEGFDFVVATTGVYFVRVQTATTTPANEGTYRLLVNQCPAPTASMASVSGRVLTASGKALPKASISLTAPNGEVRYAMSGRTGAYRFDDLEVGQTYVLKAMYKPYRFSQQVITITENLDEVDFIASP